MNTGFLADLHIHSRFSRATSKQLNTHTLAAWAAVKGLHVLGTGDFTHPGWRAELRDTLKRDEGSGLYRLRDRLDPTLALSELERVPGPEPRFLLQAEISSIYKRHGVVRKVHNLVFMPDMDSAEKLCRRLEAVGNLTADGRPILGLDSHDLLEMVLETEPQGALIPAHIWTPWFAVFGSKSGFNSMEECFGDLTPHIFALETGLSSDPAMNRLWSHLDGYTLISNSDAHSPANLGREANLFTGPPSYAGIFAALRREPSSCAYAGTLEFFPEEGKYHLDGHRACGVVLEPREALALRNICPVCGKPLTIGVLHRVQELADRTTPPPLAEPGFASLTPLPELLGELLGVGPQSRKVAEQYSRLVREFGAELDILRTVPTDILRRRWEGLGEGIARMRAGKVILRGGYDGEYGVVRVFTEQEALSFRSGGSRAVLPGMGISRRHAGSVGKANNRGKADNTDRATTPLPLLSTKTAHDGAASSARSAAATLPLLPGAPPVPLAEEEARRAETPSSGFAAVAATAPSAEEKNAAPLPDSAPNAPFPWLRAYSEEQRAALCAGPGPVLVMAGPGAGKTHTLMGRIAHLRQTGVAARDILVLTFTRRAAGELRRRLEAAACPANAGSADNAAGPANAATDMPVCDTLHALAWAWLCGQFAAPAVPPASLAAPVAATGSSAEKDISEYPSPTTPASALPIFSATASACSPCSVAAVLGENRSIAPGTSVVSSDAVISPDPLAPVLLTEESARRIFAEANADLTAAEMRQMWAELELVRERRAPLSPELERRQAAYARGKARWHAVDYTELLELWLAWLEEEGGAVPSVAHVLVDEVQDLSPLQWAVLRRLLPPDGTGFFGIGDPDQAIYGFRGAQERVREFLEGHWPRLRCHVLTLSWRNAPAILACAENLMRGHGQCGRLTASTPRPAQLRLFTAPSAEAEARWVGEQVAALLGGVSHTLADAAKSPTVGVLAPGDVAVLVRTRAQMPILHAALAQRGIPCAVPEEEGFWREPRVARLLEEAARVFFVSANAEDASSASTVLGVTGAPATAEATKMFSDPLPLSAWTGGPGVLRRHVDGLPGFDALFWASAAWKGLEKLWRSAQGWPGLLGQVALLRDVELVREKAERVQIMTIHAAKGLEFQAVFLPGLEDGLLPLCRERLRAEAGMRETGAVFARKSVSATESGRCGTGSGKANESMTSERAAVGMDKSADTAGKGAVNGVGPDTVEEEERRLLYVGITRAASLLFCSHAEQRPWQGGMLRLAPSRFLAALRSHCRASVLKAARRTEQTQLRLL